MDLKRRFGLSALAVAQVIKFLIILAIVAGVAYGIYFAWTNFIKRSSSTVSRAGAARTARALNPK